MRRNKILVTIGPLGLTTHLKEREGKVNVPEKEGGLGSRGKDSKSIL